MRKGIFRSRMDISSNDTLDALGKKPEITADSSTPAPFPGPMARASRAAVTVTGKGRSLPPSPLPPIPYRCWSVSYARYLIAFWAPLAESELMSPIVSRLSLYRSA